MATILYYRARDGRLARMVRDETSTFPEVLKNHPAAPGELVLDKGDDEFPTVAEGQALVDAALRNVGR